MKRMSKKEFASYPEFVMYVDFRTYNGTPAGSGIAYKALQASDALEAMREAEAFIKNSKDGSLYLIILAKKEGVQECLNSYVVTYKEALTTRVHYEYGKADYSNWNFTDEEHYEVAGEELKAVKVGSSFDIWR